MKRSFTQSKRYVDSILILVTVIWGLKPVIIKLGLYDLTPVQYTVWRLIFAMVSAWIVLYLSGEYRKIDREDIKSFIFISVFGFFIFQWFYGIGIGKTTAGNASIIMGTLPMLVSVVSHLAHIEKIESNNAIGILISFFGLLIVVSNSGEIGSFSENIAGSTYIFISAFAYSLYMVYSKPLSEKYSPKQITTIAITITTFLAVIFSGFDINVSNQSIPLLFSLLYSGVIAMFVANYFWTWAIKRSSSTRVSLFNNLPPIFSIIFGSLILKETFSPFQFIGGGIIFAGLYISTKGFKE